MVCPSTCCSALVAILANQTSFPGDAAYNASLGSYFSAQEAQLRPACIVSPTETAHVAAAVSALTRQKDCHFAVRGGGHTTWAGAANIGDNHGVTLDLRRLDTVRVNQQQDKSSSPATISVGAGNRWINVYRGAEAHGLVVPGGRVGTVGVGGLSLGGGISSFGPRFGWTCDAIAEAEIVLADGRVVRANDDNEYADLLHALRGGSNNFGVVTQFEFHAYPQGDMWGGNTNHAADTAEKQLEATARFASDPEYDEYASLVQGFNYVQGMGFVSVTNTLHYTKPVEYPATFKPFTDIPQTDNTLRVANTSNFADEGTAGSPSGFRSLLATVSHGSSLPMLQAAFNVWNQSVVGLSAVSGLQFRFVLEPIPASAYKKAAAGTNVLGVTNYEGGLIITGLLIGWVNAADDALVNRVAKEIVDGISAKAKELGQDRDLVYLNYASPWQDVISSYGAANVAEMKRVSKKYDPNGIFQKNVPGGFKLPF